MGSRARSVLLSRPLLRFHQCGLPSPTVAARGAVGEDLLGIPSLEPNGLLPAHPDGMSGYACSRREVYDIFVAPFPGRRRHDQWRVFEALRLLAADHVGGAYGWVLLGGSFVSSSVEPYELRAIAVIPPESGYDTILSDLDRCVLESVLPEASYALHDPKVDMSSLPLVAADHPDAHHVQEELNRSRRRLMVGIGLDGQPAPCGYLEVALQ